ncbi:MAG: NADH-quinone oxidoreductase subunit J [Pedosphaera sp. Tous-C6FEB]|nr:MAG: NADH-quinone oxidoreductase subunit J [Pedosphaera sp. Tous-C6FEB]
MTLPFAIIAGLTVGSAIAAMSLRNLVHCALSLVLTFAGLAGLYLQLNAEFVGFTQILVYVGAVSILIVFAILLTRGTEPANEPATVSPWAGIPVAALAFAAMAVSVLGSPVGQRKAAPMGEASVKTLGQKLMTDFVLPLEVMALLLTAAMLGAVIIAMREKESK